MTREEIKTLLPVIMAYAEGKEIELSDTDGNWHATSNLSFCRPPKYYRIKPCPKYRPFENAEELLNVMKRHTPCGLVRSKELPKKTLLEYQSIVSFDNEGIALQTSKGRVYVGYPLAFETLVFSDNKPFGVYKKSD